MSGSSSQEISRSSSTSRSQRRAWSRSQPQWASNMSSKSGSAARARYASATLRSKPAGPSSGPSVKKCFCRATPTARTASAAASCSGSCPTPSIVAQAGTRSRVGPPSSRCTGTPKCRPHIPERVVDRADGPHVLVVAAVAVRALQAIPVTLPRERILPDEQGSRGRAHERGDVIVDVAVQPDDVAVRPHAEIGGGDGAAFPEPAAPPGVAVARVPVDRVHLRDAVADRRGLLDADMGHDLEIDDAHGGSYVRAAPTSCPGLRPRRRQPRRPRGRGSATARRA